LSPKHINFCWHNYVHVIYNTTFQYTFNFSLHQTPALKPFLHKPIKAIGKRFYPTVNFTYHNLLSSVNAQISFPRYAYLRKHKKNICAKQEKIHRNSKCSRPARLGCRLNGRGFEFQNVRKVYLLFRTSKVVLGFTQPPTLRVLEALSPMVKRPKRQADHSNPSGTDVNQWNYRGPCIMIYSYNKTYEMH
jgi:hypothetical protein